MIIDGFVDYGRRGTDDDKLIDIDTSRPPQLDNDAADAVSFALFGKTVFRDIFQQEAGIPTVALSLFCEDVTVFLVRRPPCTRQKENGVCRHEELFSATTCGNGEIPDLSPEEHYDLLNKHFKMTYEDFVAYLNMKR